MPLELTICNHFLHGLDSSLIDVMLTVGAALESIHGHFTYRMRRCLLDAMLGPVPAL